MKSNIKLYTISFITGGVLNLLVTGCATPPEELIKEARKKATTEQEAALDAELESQANKFALFRSYLTTKQIAVAIVEGESTLPKGSGLGGTANYTVSEFKLSDGSLCGTIRSYDGVGISCVPACPSKPKSAFD